MSTPAEREFPGDTSSPARARGFATSALVELLPALVVPTVSEDIELVVSELVTNAVRAGSATITVSIARDDDRVAVQVRDTAPGWPAQRSASIHDVSGRGLALVSAICASWGVRLVPGGKTVWAELEVPATPVLDAHS